MGILFRFKSEEKVKTLSLRFEKLWVFAEIFLFSYVGVEDNLAVYTFHFSIAFLENDDPIVLKKDDFKIVDDDKNIASNCFLKNISISSSTINGEKKETVKFDLLEKTKHEKIDGAWNNTIASFAKSFNYKTCSFLDKGRKAEVLPGYTLD